MIKKKKTCATGHVYYKSSDCPTYPTCEAARKPQNEFTSLLPAPAIRALEAHGIGTVDQLAQKTERDILSLHGVGPASLPILRKVLLLANRKFQD